MPAASTHRRRSPGGKHRAAHPQKIGLQMKHLAKPIPFCLAFVPVASTSRRTKAAVVSSRPKPGPHREHGHFFKVPGKHIERTFRNHSQFMRKQHPGCFRKLPSQCRVQRRRCSQLNQPGPNPVSRSRTPGAPRRCSLSNPLPLPPYQRSPYGHPAGVLAGSGGPYLRRPAPVERSPRILVPRATDIDDFQVTG